LQIFQAEFSLGFKPRMSSIGVFASLFDAAGRILLVRQAYGSRHWTTPGGGVEEGECPLAALHRELLEEIACEVQVGHLIGVYAKPYRDDLVLSFAVTLVRGSPQACSTRNRTDCVLRQRGAAT
jgi:8-oxo-dGTP diphosphatase